MSKKSDKELQILIGAILLMPILLFVASSISQKDEKSDEKQ